MKAAKKLVQMPAPSRSKSKAKAKARKAYIKAVTGPNKKRKAG